MSVKFEPNEVWQYCVKEDIIFLVLDSYGLNQDSGMQMLRFVYLSYDECPERVGCVFEKHLKPNAHRRIA